MTIREIAKLARVSPGVVSRMLNHDPSLRISATTRQRIEEIVKKTGYQKTTSRYEVAVLLALNKKRVSQDPYFSDLLQGILSYCRLNNLKVVQTIWLPDNTALTQLKHLHGVLVIGPFTIAAIKRMKQIANAFVLVDDNTNVPKTNQVKSNFDEITSKILDDFLTANRNRISFVGGSIERINQSGKTWDNLIDLRLSTYYDWSKRHLLTPDIINVGLTIEDGRKAAQFLLSRRKNDNYSFPNGIIALNDLIARGMIDAFGENNINVPDDVCIASFDDLMITRIKAPTITSVNIPTNELANAAVRLLRDQINHSLVGTNIITVPGTINYRDSFSNKLIMK